MQLHDLKRIHPNKKPMIVARGGKRGKTAGRGGKGQSARAGNKRRPEWRDIIKKLPKLRGRGVNPHKSIVEKPVPVNVQFLEAVFSANESVTPTTLVEKGLVSTMSGRIPIIKILGDGDLSKSLKISGCLVSNSAKAKIEKAGGTVTSVKPMVEVTTPAPVKADTKKQAPIATQKEAKKVEKTQGKAAKPAKATKKK